MTTKKSAPKKSAPKKKPVNQEPIPMQSKIIGLVIVAVLAGFSIFWFVAKNKLQSIDKKVVKYLEDSGFAVSNDEIEISGFPFSVKASVPKLKLTRGEPGGMNIMIQADQLSASVSPWRPSRVNLTGPVTYGIYAGGVPFLQLQAQRGRVDVDLSRDIKHALSDWKVYEVDVLKGDAQEKVVSIGELSASHDEKTKGDLTHIVSEIELEKVDFAATLGTSIVVDEASLEAEIASPYKNSEDLSRAIQSFNTDFNNEMKKRCAEGAEHMPPLKEAIETLEKNKSHFDIKLKLKGGKYGVALKLKGSVKDTFPNLTLKAEMKNLDKLLDLAVEMGLLAPNVGRNVTLVLANIGEVKGDERHVELSLEDRKLTMGDKTLWEFKETDWDHIPIPAEYCKRMNLETPQSEGGEKTGAQEAVAKGQEAAATLAALSPPV